jgi:hypothetical protein
MQMKTLKTLIARFIVLLLLTSALSTAMASENIDYDLLRNIPVLLIGEIHGTREIPEFITSLATKLIKQGDAVVVGVEWPYSENKSIKTFMESKGSKTDKDAMLSSQYWKSSKDGKTSTAMFDLVNSLQQLKHAGKDVEILAFDQSGDEPNDTDINNKPRRTAAELRVTRDNDMAQNLLQKIKKRPNAKFIILTGNIHSAIEIGVPWNPLFKPMGYFLSQNISLKNAAFLTEGGNAWYCSSTGCAVNTVGAGIQAISEHNLVLPIGKLTASPPIIEAR